MSDLSFERTWSVHDMDEVIITPEECSTQGGERLIVTFPRELPTDPILIFLHGSSKTHKLEAERINECTIAVTLPAHNPAEVVDLSIYQMPTAQVCSENTDYTYQPHLLLEDKILYTDMSSYLAELLVQSVNDNTQAFYSMLPPLASLDVDTLTAFDHQLTCALKEVELPEGWSILQSGEREGTDDTLLHFAARNSLSQLFTLLFSLPGGRQAVSLRNKDGKTPLDVARERNSSTIITLLESLQASESPTLLSLLSRCHQISSSLQSELQLLQFINNDWIGKQRSANERNLPTSLPHTPTSYQHSVPSFMSYFRGAREGQGSTAKGDLSLTTPPIECLVRGGNRRAWSRVVGIGRSRSVGTGLNELFRLSGHQSTLELQDEAHQKVSDHSRLCKQEVLLGGWSVSCPLLCDDAVSDIPLNSSLTSPGTFDTPTFLADFVPVSTLPDDPTHSGDAPHKSLTISVENEEVATSVSPHSVIPTVCVENPECERVCLTPPINFPLDNTGAKGNQPREGDENFLLNIGTNFAHSSGEEDEEEEKVVNRLIIQGPLASKSAPAFPVSCNEEDDAHSIDDTNEFASSPCFKAKSYSISGQGQLNDVISDEEDDKRRDREWRSQTPVSNPLLEVAVTKVSTTPSTPVTTPIAKKKTHRKSLSMSGVAFDRDNEREEEENVPRSHGSSFISMTSSKQETTSSDEEDDSETANESETKLKSGTPHLSPSAASFKDASSNRSSIGGGAGRGSRGGSQSEDDAPDGKEIRGRGYMLNVVTNVDDYSASSEDEGKASRHTSEETTPTHCLTAAVDKEEEFVSSGNSRPSEDDVALSDIEVQLDNSLDKSPVPPQQEMDKPVSAAIGNGTPPILSNKSVSVGGTLPLPPKGKSPLLSRSSVPVIIDAKQTIQLLKTLVEQESATTMGGAQSTSPMRPKSETMPVRPLSLPSDATPPTSGAALIAKHITVSRNNSSASDTGINYSQAPPMVGGSSSLDFVRSPDCRVSPRASPRFFSQDATVAPHPPSPLYVSKSPRTSPRERERSDSPASHKVAASSPLEKKAKSVDNLLNSSEVEGEKGRLDDKEALPSKPNVRFEDGSESEMTAQRKDIQSYLGIIEATPALVEAKEHTKSSKGISKLFRRDSKKEKRSSKKTDSLSSIDSVFVNAQEGATKDKLNKQLQSLVSQPAGGSATGSPILRKPRSQTIHGDLNLTLSSTSLNSEQHSASQPDPITSSSSTIKESLLESSNSPPPIASPSAKLEGSVAESEISDDLSVNIEDHPLLNDVMDDEVETSWYRTIDRRLRRSINKHEKGRQGAIFDFIRTERHIYGAVLILKLIFRDKLASELGITEDVLSNLFPSLDNLLEVTRDFSTKLEARQRQSMLMIDDISDILLDQFTGKNAERMKEAYTGFICRQSEALELYRDMERKRQKMARLMAALYTNKYCERRKLQDFFLLITQRVAKYVEMMKKLLKETEILKLEHVERLRKCNSALQDMVRDIDNGVLEYENRKELEDIQSRLEIHVPRNSKLWSNKLKGLKALDLCGQNRKLIKTVDVQWHAHGKSLGVRLVLVTDLIVLLTERDQKYHLASLQDSKPPVIRLFDLHVRVNASVRSGVQLLLLEQGELPEMYRVEFSSKKEAKDWEERLNGAVEYCRSNELRCEHFGTEKVLSGDEGREDEEFDGDPDPLPDLSPNSIRHMMIHTALSQAHQLLMPQTTVAMATTSHDQPMPRHSMAATTSHRNHQLPPPHHSNQRNKPVRSTTFSSRTASVDVLDSRRKKKAPERGQSFVEKKDESNQDRQTLMECISNLKESVEYLLKEDESKTAQISKLKQDLMELRSQSSLSNLAQTSPVFQRPSSAQRSFRSRPHSIHSELFKAEELLAATEGQPPSVSQNQGSSLHPPTQ